MVNVVFNLVNLVFTPVVSFVVPWFEAEWCYHCHLLGVRSDQAPAPHPLWQKRQSTCLFLHRWLFLWVTKSLHKAQKLQSWSPIPPALTKSIGTLGSLTSTWNYSPPPPTITAFSWKSGPDPDSRLWPFQGSFLSWKKCQAAISSCHFFFISSAGQPPTLYLQYIPCSAATLCEPATTFLLLQSSTSQNSESIVTASPPHLTLVTQLSVPLLPLQEQW